MLIAAAQAAWETGALREKDKRIMIIIMKHGASQANVDAVVKAITAKGLQAHLSQGDQVTIIGAVGDKTRLMHDNLELIPGVDKILSVTETYKLANKKFHPQDSTIWVGDTPIGPGQLSLMAGPCAIESEDQMMETARSGRPGLLFCAAGPISPVLRRMRSRGWRKRGFVISAGPGTRPG